MKKYILHFYIIALVLCATGITTALSITVGRYMPETGFMRVSPMLMKEAKYLESAGALEEAAARIQAALEEGFIAVINVREANSRLGLIRWKQRRFDEARAFLEAAICTPRPNWGGAPALMDILLRQGEPEAALKVAERWKTDMAGGDEASQAMIEAGAGRALLALGKSEEGRERLEDSLKLAPGGPASLPLAQWHADAGDRDEAVLLLQQYMLAGGGDDAPKARALLEKLTAPRPGASSPQ